MHSAGPIWRPRIVERIERALRHRIALIAAPAGFGKSIALDQVVARLDEPVLRIRLPQRAHDVTALVGAFAAALDVMPGADPALVAALRATEPVPAKLVPALEAAIDSTASTVAIDGLTRLCMRDEGVRDLLAALVAHSALRWLIVTRTALGLPVASWMAYDHCGVPVGTADLAFTEDEARQVAEGAGVGGGAAVDAAFQWTAGWPTAFVLALRDPSTSPSRGVVADFLAEHVMHEVAEADHALLVRLALLPMIDLAHGAAFEPDQPEEVEEALRRSAPIVDEVGDRVYRVHPLVRAFLISRLKRRASGDYALIAERTGRALLAAGRHADAIQVFTDAGDAAAIERIVSAEGHRLVERGETRQLTAAIRVLSDAGRADTAAILSLRATLASYGGDSRAATALSERAIAAARDPDEKLRLINGFALELVKHAGSGARETLARIAPALADACAGFGADAPFRLELLGTLALVRTFLGDAEGAHRALAEKLEAAESSDDRRLRATTYHQASYIAYIDGDAERSARYAAAAARLATEAGLFPLAARSHSIQYAIAMELHDAYDRALAALGAMFEAANRSDDRFLQIEALAGMAHIHGERGDEDGVESTLQRVQALDVGLDTQTTSLLPVKALFAAWQGDFQTAYELVAHSAPDQPTALRKAVRWCEIALYGAVAGMRDAALGALECATQAERSAEIVNRDDRHRVARAAALRALTLLVLGNTASANSVLRDAERSRRTLSRRMQALIDGVRGAYLSVETGSQDGLEKALAALRAADLGGLARLVAQLPFERGGNVSPIGQLTRTEVEVLRAVARAGSNAKAAAALGRSVNTVNVHVKSILRKLHCTNRHEALAIAREHGLVA